MAVEDSRHDDEQVKTNRLYSSSEALSSTNIQSTHSYDMTVEWIAVPYMTAAKAAPHIGPNQNM